MIASIPAKTSAEQAVLGSVLINPKCAGEVISRTDPEMFCPELRPIYLAMRALWNRGEPVDPISIRQLVPGDCIDLLFQIAEITPTAVHVREYLDQLILQSKLLAVRALADRFASSADSDDIPELLAALTDAGTPRRVRRYTPEERWERFACRQVDEPETFLPWGFPQLDKALHAGAGDFVIIGAEPSMGKTALAIQLAAQQAKYYKIGFYSLETSEGKLTDREVAMRYGTELAQIKRHEISADCWEAMASGRLERSYDVIEASGWSVEEIEADAVGNGYQIVYIDYLQLLKHQKNETEYQAVTRISQSLHTLAQSRKITVVGLSQFSRPEGASEPTMHDLRSSGQIEQDADIIMLLYAVKKDGADSRRLKIAKNKEGSRGHIYLTFDGKKQKFGINWAATDAGRRERERQAATPVAFKELPQTEPVPFPEQIRVGGM